MSPTDTVRVDRWLWAVRLHKTRTLAAAACRAGHVRVNGHPAKAARDIRPGDLLTVRLGSLTRTVRVRAVLEDRVGAPRVPEYLEDLTPPEELAKPRQPGRRAPGAGRPTKRERRLLEAWLELPTEPAEDPPRSPEPP